MPRKPAEKPTPALLAFLEFANSDPGSARLSALRGLIQTLIHKGSGVGRAVNVASFLSLSTDAINDLQQKVRDVFQSCAALADANDVVSDPAAYDTDEYYQSSGLMKNTTIRFPSVSSRRRLVWRPGGHLQFEHEALDLWGCLIDALLSGTAEGRIRSCKVCGDVFWVRRRGQKTCSPRHAAAWRSRTYYNRHLRTEPTRGRGVGSKTT